MTPIRSNRVAIAATLAIAIVSCAPSPESARYTVEAYRADAELRREQLARCANDPGALGDTPDCVNVREAARLEERRSLRDLPPIELPRKTEPDSGSASRTHSFRGSVRSVDVASTHPQEESFWTKADAFEVEGRREGAQRVGRR